MLCACGLCLQSSSIWPRVPDAAGRALSGQVLDARDGTALPGATIAVLGTALGAHTDETGHFRLEGLPPGRYDLLISFIGYLTEKVRGVEPDSGRELRILLQPSAVEVPGVVVSATRRVQSFAAAPISMAVADSRQLAVHNALTLSGPLKDVPGVSMVGSQVNVRGSSGYTRGAGSRVLLLVDGFPMLSADLGDIKWDAIPVGEVERVEVVKGAGSALYGTGALGGVINVITRQPSDQPQTGFRLVSGLYSQPAHRSWEWTDDVMYLAGVDLSHSRQLGQTGLRFAAGHKRGTGYHENGDFRRHNLYVKKVHRFARGAHWTTLASWAVDDHGVFIQWKDRQTPLRVPDKDRGASTVSWKLNLNSGLYGMRSRTLGYRLKMFYFRTGFDNTREAGGLRSDGHKFGSEAQADWAVAQSVDVTGGAVAAWDLVRAPADFLGQRHVLNLAFYGHAAYRPLPGAEVSTGLRLDVHRRDRYTESAEGGGACPPAGGPAARVERELSPQVGLSYRLAPGTALRASAGLGFRAPSVSEIYTQAEASGLLVCPNPALRAERSRSLEVGLKQRLGELAALDLALFWNSYDGLIEARADPSLAAGTPTASFRNISEARIRGLEIEQQVALPRGFRWRFSYTLLGPVEFLDEDDVLPPYCHDQWDPGDEAPLPYRARHTLKTGLMAARGPSRAGVSFEYSSRFERVSGLFPDCRRDQLPVYLLDGFVTHGLGDVALTLRVDNLLQYHYALTERKIRGPRQVSLSLTGVL